MTPMKLFYHVALLNHWDEIVCEQLTTIKDSGFYDNCDEIFVGCVGKISEYERLKEVFKENGIEKVHFYHHPDIKQYEFFTLKIMKRVCDNSDKLFYGAYIMSKGCSYNTEPNKTSGKVWRDYMMRWVITNWKENYHAMTMKYRGYDLCCVKVVPARESPNKTTHASGNFFSFNSEYIKSLPKVEDFDTTNRFYAEIWPYVGQPIIYMPCNLFIDYMNRQTSYDDFVKNYPEYKEYCL